MSTYFVKRKHCYKTLLLEQTQKEEKREDRKKKQIVQVVAAYYKVTVMRPNERPQVRRFKLYMSAHNYYEVYLHTVLGISNKYSPVVISYLPQF